MLRGILYILGYARRCVRFLVFMAVALFLPKLGVLYMQTQAKGEVISSQGPLRLGIENITDEFLRSLTPKGDLSYTVGLVTNQSGKNQAGKRTIDILVAHGLKVKKIFVPEHGLDGIIDGYDHDKERVHHDKITKIPVVLLYGDSAPKRLDGTSLHDIDVLMFDIQEMGMRHNTYLTTLFQTLEAVAAHKKKLVVFDRPNALGSSMEGPLVEDAFKSVISYAAIPIRHGMTVGELALYYNEHCAEQKAQIHVVPMANYNRYQPLYKVSRLSPNIDNINSCYGYSFLGMLGEVTPFDVAVGTDKAFQCITLPDSIKFPQKKWYELMTLLKEQGVESKFHRFYSPRKKEYCSGLRLHIPDVNLVASFKSLLMVLTFFKKSGIELQFSKSFDKAVGTNKVREYVDGRMSKYELETAVNTCLHEFFNKATVAFKYRPHPYVVQL